MASAHSQMRVPHVSYPPHGLHHDAVERPQESYTADSYTQEGLDHIRATNFKSLVLRHYPELEAWPLLVCFALLLTVDPAAPCGLLVQLQET